MKRLSIILPIYNVETYIKVGLESIFRQGLDDDDFEVSLVNDGTPDNSIGVVDDIISQHQILSLSIKRTKGYPKPAIPVSTNHKVSMFTLWILMICWLITRYLFS